MFRVISDIFVGGVFIGFFIFIYVSGLSEIEERKKEDLHTKTIVENFQKEGFGKIVSIETVTLGFKHTLSYREAILVNKLGERMVARIDSKNQIPIVGDVWEIRVSHRNIWLYKLITPYEKKNEN